MAFRMPPGALPGALARLKSGISQSTAPRHQSHRAKLGTSTEALVELHNDLCERMGVCALRRVPTPMRVIGTTPKGVEPGPSGVRFAFTNLKPKQRADLRRAPPKEPSA